MSKNSGSILGFHELKEGKIHLRCYQCGRMMSNVDRDTYDPPRAVLVEAECEKHQGSIEPPVYFYDVDGVEIPDDEVMKIIDPDWISENEDENEM